MAHAMALETHLPPAAGKYLISSKRKKLCRCFFIPTDFFPALYTTLRAQSGAEIEKAISLLVVRLWHV